MQQRRNWIDWAKAIGMLLIVWGHCFPPMLTSFVYAFSVPVFFFISGYLSKREESRTFYNKLFHGLFLPYLLLSLIKSSGYMFHHIGDGGFVWSLIGIATGFHHINDASACGNLWFVYTLMLIKIISHISGYRTKSLIAIAVISFFGAAIYGSLGYEIPWALPALLSAMPFFVLGYLIKHIFSQDINSFINNISAKSRVSLSAASAVAFILIYLISSYNGAAWMYMGLFGNNIFMFAVTSLLGIFAIFAVSSMLDRVKSKITLTISIGTILILVFHRELLHPMLKLINNAGLNDYLKEVMMFCSSVVVLLIFVPAIKIVERFMPVLLGNRSSKAK